MPEVKVPELAESITEGTIAEWLKQKGDSVEKGEAILELETDKVNVEVVSEEAGVLQELLANEGDTVEVGQAIAVVGEGSGSNSSESSANDDSQKNDSSSNDAQPQQVEEQNQSTDDAKQDNNQRINATPSARKYAREKGIDLSEVASQSNDVVRKEHVAQSQQQPTSQQAPAKEEAKKPAQQNPTKPVIREKMSRRKKTAAKKLLEVSNNTAMLTTFNEIDMTNVMNLRKRKKEQFIKDHDGTKLGFMSFFTKAAVAALKKYPEVNAEIDGDDMITKQYYDIGVAVSTEDGLLVPFVRDCDKKNFAEIENEIANLAKKARDKKLGLDDMVNGSFTITNGGIFGSMMSTPIINGSQAAILGMHSIITRPIAVDADTIENRPMMYIALSYDHRIIDGKEAVGFLKTIKELIENPEDLLLES
ncbi:dihydrolipoyllysine-residue succinyltransferase [Staphylococcus succinus]|jgi:2-oxoglutarate dehydrogenase E2 component (dihydrolipoamide succinyltransferase)|uniref:Dihydrolipoyllysine-residue succinyltransferase component of 2-oxoglutarate dehydrogenase complex n=1 Tax=Staphylococcus succinus TaxID=61015 RepID=A0A9Q6HPQ4_9STAP|nr:dihydrolipoyllysine-residue succinyltransferase [Staphylococcus succinus]MEB7461490.1 dihydrolipoyllysine-residue succinyltransferase [Staphylococcus succinus]MEB8126545.1 dihydrolipoyllysine-residue succinyltransferase [Staphylococcus succinus]MEB8209395.1 dihydrolipoyllysine-residue succinyltransferase [Staphylococcus succinus]PTI43322.1 dihydrolipoyllysine-residue succinyltransferase [Staphylococcus succinus]PTI76173.1 dihydrolipoyllysine-residue succinyltransferase [Staphylococcus succi